MITPPSHVWLAAVHSCDDHRMAMASSLAAYPPCALSTITDTMSIFRTTQCPDLQIVTCRSGLLRDHSPQPGAAGSSGHL